MKTQNFSIFLAFFIVFTMNCTGRGNVDLSKATPLTAEPVKTPPTGGSPGSSGDNTQYNGLFNLQPGQWVSFKALGGVVDPVGTVLSQDFDGDGIANDKETTSNMWVADYPVVEAEIAPPVTLKIELLKTSTSEAATIDTNLSSDNFESRKGEGTEKFHQDEVNLRTINNGTDTNTSTSTETSNFALNVKADTSVSFFDLADVDIKTDTTYSTSNTSTNTNQSVRQTFEDRPFKNNIDRSALSTKSDTAEKKARDYRREKRAKTTEDFTTKSDAGIVRAALYIKNHSVNMPVKLSNILCSLVFETPSGALLPIQSFRLRNDDFSLFEVEIYGNSEFGPYVVELKNLNTVEIENAIAQGYTPKIYIVDYKMTHVQDSNYRLALSSSFTGDNLKIIEENAKGRTALLKLIYPGFRNMFRVTAFNTQLTSTGSDICNPAHIDTSSNSMVSPGISMVKLLERLRCSGIDIQFGHYIYDFTGTELASKYPKIYLYTIKSINGVGVSAPCNSMESGTGYLPATNSYGAVSNVCFIKIKDLTDIQLDNLRIWATFDNAKYYTATEFATDTGGNIRTFDGISIANCGQPAQVCGIPVMQSVTSTAWAGDNYDIVYLRMSDFMGRRLNFGTNPLETGATLAVNTVWDNAKLGDYPFDPEVKANFSSFLGKVGLGETIELTFNLKDTTFLNPNFGNDTDPTSNLAFTNFSYDRQKTTKKFNIEEALDFEINLGLGGNASDWQNIMRPPTGSGAITRGPVTVDYLNQQFSVQVTLPATHPLMANDGSVGIYLRPALTNAYRNSIWPQDYRQVKKYDAKVHLDVATGTSLQIKSGIGSIADVTAGTDSVKIVTDGTVYTYAISSISSPTSYGFEITLGGSGVSVPHKSGDRVYVDAGLSSPQLSVNVDYTSSAVSFFESYNGLYPQQYLLPDNGAANCSNILAPTRCYGYGSAGLYDFAVNNWLGGYGFDNSWVDGAKFLPTFANGFMFPYILARSGQNRMMLRRTGVQQYTVGSDFLVNSTTVADQQYPKVASSGNRSLIVWSSYDNGSNSDIRGRVVDIQSGNVVGSGDFLISSTNNNSQIEHQVSIAGNKAIVVWSSRDNDSNFDIRGRVVDLQSGVPLGSGDFLISSSNSQDQNIPKIASFGDTHLITWESADNGVDPNIRGRFVSTATYGVIGSADFLISTSNSSYQHSPQVVVDGAAGLVVWFSMDNAGDPNIRGRLIDMQNMLLVGSGDFQLNTTTNNSQSYARVAAQGGRAMVVWHSYDNNADYDIMGRVVDLKTGALIGTTDFRISTTNAGEQDFPNVIAMADRAFVVWTSADTDANDIRGRFVDLITGTAIGTSDFLVNTTNNLNQDWPVMVANGDTIVVAWHSHDHGYTDADIRGRVYSMSAGAPVDSSDFLISSTGSGTGSNQLHPEIAVSNNKAVITWVSNDISGNSGDYEARAAILDLPTINLLYGQNNFFTAPLIERNYTVTSKIKF